MKLFRFGKAAEEKPGVVYMDKFYDASSFGEDYNEKFFSENGIARLNKWFSEHKNSLPEVRPESRLGVPIVRPSKIICIGLNYSDHAQEAGLTVPPEPVIFFKATSAITGPNDELIIPRKSTKTDWEVELAVVIGRKASYVEEAEAMEYVAGYCLHNDYSEREFQIERSGQWVKGKSCDTFAPLGPYLVTKDEISDPHQLNMWLEINGVALQKGSTANMIYKIPFLISYVSQFMSLLPGDVISTGTPAGVGMGMKPQRFIKEGDIITLGIDGLGSQRQKAVNFR